MMKKKSKLNPNIKKKGLKIEQEGFYFLLFIFKNFNIKFYIQNLYDQLFILYIIASILYFLSTYLNILTF
jgi:hypothetical protein